MRIVTHGKPSRKPRRRKPEAKLQSALVKFLEALGAKVCITDAGILRKHGIKNRNSGIPDGWTDLLVAMPNGVTWYIECKSPKGSMSPDQREFREWLMLHGFHYVLARTMDDVIDAIGATDA